MTNSLKGWIAVFSIALLTVNTFAVTRAGVAYIGRGAVSGPALGKSGLAGDICQASNPSNCVSKTILGGFGSDVTYTGHHNVFIATPDRGPFDEMTDVAYIDRFHLLHITTDLTRPFNQRVQMLLLDTRLMRNEVGEDFLGAGGAFDLRFDPEGIRVAPNGTFNVPEEHGTHIFQFDRQGNIIRRLPVPSRFFIARPSNNPESLFPPGQVKKLLQRH